MEKEIVIWGKTIDSKFEEPLFTNAKTIEEAKTISQVLENKFGCSDIRIAEYDYNELPDFTKSINL